MQIATESMSTPKPRTWASLLKRAEDKNKGSATVDATPPLNKTANDAADGSSTPSTASAAISASVSYSQALLGKSVAEGKMGQRAPKNPRLADLSSPDLGMEDSRDGLNLAFKNTISIKTTSSQSSPTKANEAGSSSSPHAKSPKQEIEPLTAEKIAWRQKQIDLGKKTEGYKKYRAVVPLEVRPLFRCPQTPDKHAEISKRNWVGQYKAWRRQLHLYDSVQVPEEALEAVAAATAAAATPTVEKQSSAPAVRRISSWADEMEDDEEIEDAEEEATEPAPTPNAWGVTSPRKLHPKRKALKTPAGAPRRKEQREELTAEEM